MRDSWGLVRVWGVEKGVFLIKLLSFVWTAVFARWETSIGVLRPWHCTVGDSRSAEMWEARMYSGMYPLSPLLTSKKGLGWSFFAEVLVNWVWNSLLKALAGERQ